MILDKYIYSRMQIMNSKSNKLDQSLYQSLLYKGMPITSYTNFSQNLSDGYMKNEIVYSIVNKIANTASSIPIELVNKNNEVVYSRWINKLLQFPNDDKTFAELYKAFLIYYLVIGNGNLYAPKLSGGVTTEIDIMPADYTVAVSGGWNNPIRGWKLYIGTQEIELPKEDVFHMAMFNPSFYDGNFIYGLSPIKVAADIINNLNAGEERMQKMLEDGIPPYIISAKGDEGLTEEQAQTLEKKYAEKYGNVANPNKPLLSGTELKVDKLGFSAQDLSLIENSTYGLRVLCNVYGVDSKMFNDPAASTYNNMPQVYVSFYNDTIKPLNNLFAAKLTNFLIKDTGLHFRFNYDGVAILGEAKADLMTKYSGITFLSDTEKREIFMYKPLNDITNG